MTEDTVIKDADPLKPNYIPNTVINRDQAISQLSNYDGTTGQNLLLHGPRGTGKTTVTHHFLQELDGINTCYTPCNQFTTQYKVLKHIYQVLTREEIGTGYHTSDLQRKIEERTGHTPIVLILDEIDFLLQNDGNSLLYFLSRLENQENLSLILISSQHTSLKDTVEERTYSSLQPRRISFEPYTAENIYQLLKQRAEKALKPQTLHREALSYIASTTQNASQAVHWLKTAAENTEDRITEKTVADTRETAFQNYANHLLQDFTDHHRLLFQTIEELTEKTDSVNTGDIYTRYQEISHSYNEEPLSNRRISDYLKHLELLHLIQSNYHYGGKDGKTRDVSLNKFNN